jgi:hypothetical protein
MRKRLLGFGIAVTALGCLWASTARANQVNLLATATLEAFGSQKDAGNRAAANVHDQSVTTRWESDKPFAPSYFVFSFADGATCSFWSLHLWNAGDKKSVRYFQMFYSSAPSTPTDPNDPSWVPIPPQGDFVNERLNLINTSMGAVLEDFGTEKDAKKAARLVADGSLKSKWESDHDRPATDNYFVFSYVGGGEEAPDSFVLYNDKGKGVKTFELLFSSDSAAATDPGHPSWTSLGTFQAQKSDAAQTYTFAAVPSRYFQFRVLESWPHDDSQEQQGHGKMAIKEMELYGTRTLGDGYVWKALKSSGEQVFDFPTVSGRYFMFRVAGTYEDAKASLYEMELWGSPGSSQVIRWREVIH